MSARTIKAVTGKETYLQVEKEVATVDTFVTVGCASSIDYGGQVEIMTANCTAGKIKVPSGEDAEYTVSLQGFEFIYASADVDANISAKEFETWFQAKTLLNFKLASGPHTGDPIRSFSGYINDFKLAGENAGLKTYNISIMVDGVPTFSAQA